MSTYLLPTFWGWQQLWSVRLIFSSRAGKCLQGLPRGMAARNEKASCEALNPVTWRPPNTFSPMYMDCLCPATSFHFPVVLMGSWLFHPESSMKLFLVY